MTRVSTATSALRRMFDESYLLSSRFNDVGQIGIGRLVSDRLGSGQSSNAGSNVGQVSAVGFNPITLEKKLEMLKRMIAKGQIALSDRISMDSVKHELQKTENDGLDIKGMVAVLTQKKLLKPKVPTPVFKLNAPAPV